MSIGKIFTLKSYEKKVLCLRRHIITFLPAILLYTLALAIPIGIAVYFGLGNGKNILDSDYAPLLILLGGTYLLSVTLFFFAYFIDFYLDVLFITNDRLVDMEQCNLFSRTVSEVDLYRIQDVTSEVKGVAAHIFNYGTLTIQTAGAKPQFKIHNIPDPHKLRQQIIDLADTDRKYHQQQK